MNKFFTVTESEIVPLTGFDFGEIFQTFTMTNGDYISLYYKANLIPSTNWGLGDVYGQRFNSHGVAVGSEFVVSTVATVDDYYAEMVELNSGQFAVLWYGIINNIPDPANAGSFITEGQYFAQVFNADGSRSGATIAVSAQEHYDTAIGNYTFGLNNSSIVKATNGGFVVTYSTYNGTSSTLVAQRYDAAGTQIGTGTTITTTAFLGGSMETTALPDGGFLMTWRGGTAADNSGVYVQRFDKLGNKVGPEFLANTFTASNQLAADVGVFSDGSYIITWQSNTQDGSSYAIVSQKFDASGNKIGGEILVNTHVTGSQNTPSVLTFSDGSYVIAWRDSDLKGDYFQRFAADGTRVGPETRLNTTGGARPFSMSALTDGGFVVSWQDITTDPVTGAVLSHTMRQEVFASANTYSASKSEIAPLTGYDFGEVFHSLTMSNGDYISLYYKANLIPSTNWGLGEVYGQRFNSQGVAIGSEFVVSDATTVDDYYAEMVELNNGQFAVVWYGVVNNIPDAANAGNFFTEGQYLAQIFNADGSRSGSTITVSGIEHFDTAIGDYTFGINNRNIVNTPNGGFLITYTTYNGTINTLVAQRYDASGVQIGSSTTVATTAVVAGTMETTSLPDGGFLMTWFGSSASDVGGVYAQRFDSAGNKVGAEFLANTFVTSTQSSADVGVFADGSYVITWQSRTQDGDLYSVVAQRFDSAGNKVGAETIINTYTKGNQYNPSILTFTDGSYVIAWRDADQKGDYFQRFAADGSRVGPETRLNTTGGARPFTMTALANGSFVVSWQDTTTDPVTGVVLTHTLSQEIFATPGVDLSGNNYIYGTSDSEVIDGGLGADTLAGGLGNDTYIIDNVGDVVIEADSAGTDLVQASANHVLSNNVENLTLTGAGNINGTGNSTANVITGNSGNNLIDGLDGADSLLGGDGSDTLIGGLGVDTVLGGAGNDGIGAFDGGSNTEQDVLDGGAGNDLIDADAYDIIEGGIGSDRVSIDFDSYGSVTGNAIALDLNPAFGGGTLNLITGGSVHGAELIKVWGTAYDDTIVDAAWNGEINAGGGADSVDGGSGNDAIMGGQGADTIVGGIGNDWLFGGIDSDTVSGGDGNDHIGDVSAYLAQFSQGASILATNYLGDFQLESYSEQIDNGSDMLSGGAGNDTIYAWGGDDTLDGGTGGDKLFGGAGNDTYIVDNSADTVTEELDGGLDTVMSSLSRTLGANQEDLVLTGVSNISGVGNELANAIAGNSGNNQIFGMDGDDVIDGGIGWDTLFGGEGADVLDGGTDKDQLSGGNGDDQLFGGDAGDTLKGEAGNDFLDGGLANDVMLGGIGDDTYIIDNSLDFVLENNGEGYDVVESSISLTLKNYFEDLTLLGTANINGIGNTAANIITGNDGNNQLFGMFGNDTISGGLGNDTISGGDSNDVLYGQDGVDQLKGGFGNDSLFGGNGNDNLKGEENHDYLDGGLGVDAMYGGAGNDTYVASELGDFYIENLNEGTDTVLASITFTLGNNFENLTLTGLGNINGTGNAGFNTLVGNEGNNTLSGLDGTDRLTGGAGNDTLLGGNGNDTYYFDLGFGQDEINDAVGTNRITFGVGISATDVITEVVGADLYIALMEADPAITASNASNRIKIIGGATVAPVITYTPVAVVSDSSALSAAITSYMASDTGSVTLNNVADNGKYARINLAASKGFSDSLVA